MQLSGWGHYPVRDVPLISPVSETALGLAVIQPYAPRGLGRSYGDAALPAYGCQALSTSFLDRFLSLDSEAGLLSAQAGISLAEVVRAIVPKGWFLPVTPGTLQVTLGGAVASNVHGKNHHQVGAIENFIESLTVQTPLGVRLCSPKVEPELFRATVGGYGLTGCITRVTLRLQRIASGSMHLKRLRADNLAQLFTLFNRHDKHNAYSVAWVDSLATGSALGQGVLLLGNHAEPGKGLPLSSAGEPQRMVNLPVTIPSGVLHPVLLPWVNGLYWQMQSEGEFRIPLQKFFYPLDRLGHWNRLYGNRGFLQYQCVIPDPHGEAGIEACLHFLAEHGLGSFLTVLKRCGDDTSGLPFCKKGYTLALDIALRDSQIPRLLDGLDDVVLHYGGRVYLAKDARLSPKHFRAMYPQWQDFMQSIRRVNPDGHCRSALSERLQLWEKD